jgi:hypothetical protein
MPEKEGFQDTLDRGPMGVSGESARDEVTAVFESAAVL